VYAPCRVEPPPPVVSILADVQAVPFHT
jgi:hypothetical protein